MARDQWYFSRNGEEKIGPTPGEHLRQWISSGQLPADTLVWRPGLDDWTPIQDIRELSVASPPPLTTAGSHGPDTERVSAVIEQAKGAFASKSVVNIFASKIFWFAVLAPILVVKILIVPAIVSGAATTVAEGYGIELSVEDWSADLLDLNATAHNAVILAPGPYAQKEFIRTEAIEVDLSLWSGITYGKWVREVRVKAPTIYMERRLSGGWNYEDLITVPVIPSASEVRLAEGAGSDRELEDSFALTRFSVEKMRLQWVENLPGGSQGGSIQEVKSTLFVDDISMSAKDLVGLVDLSPQRNSRLTLEARTGNGKISFSGQANLFAWAASQEDPETLAWMPSVEGRISLQNVSTTAFARLMPDAAIMPQDGTMTGDVDLRLVEQRVECLAQLNLDNATFAANSSSRFVANGAATINAELSGYRADGQYQFSCGGTLGDGTYRPFQAFQSNVVLHGVGRADDDVRVLASIEHVRYSEDPVDPSLEGEVNRILGNTDPEWLRWAGIAVTLRESTAGRTLRDRLRF